MSNQTVVTRFAPSPTGALHVGGARTALYAWAFARRHGGRFILRFEDTDRARSSEQSAASILDDLRWLGLDWDHGPFYQSQRLDLYNAHVERLLTAGRAYEDDGAVRFRMDADVAFDDAVYGRIEVKAKELEDFVIRKGPSGGGFPTFHLAVVVDDADMGVTHVIRGQEHLTNTTKHAALCDALGYARPAWAHTPSIMSPCGSKMSKRDKAKAARAAAEAHGLQSVGFDEARSHAFLNKENDDADIALAIAEELELQLPEVDVADFRRSGYLPEVLCNYIALLGWNPGGDVERFDREYLTEHFSLDHINKANAKFDRDKLFRFNADTLKAMHPEDFRTLLHGHFEQHHESYLHKLGDACFARFSVAYQERARTLDEPAQLGAFFIMPDDEITYDDKAVKKNLAKNDGEGYAVLRELRSKLEAIEPWSGAAAHDMIQQLAEQKKLNMGKLAQPLRVALTGNTVSPPLDATLDLLGKESVLERIDRCIETLNPTP